MSARREAFDRLVSWLNSNPSTFNAPYGVLEGTIDGKYYGSVVAYTVTFGCAATLDATVKVFSEKRLELESRGYYTRLNGVYKSVEELIEALSTEIA